MYQQEFSRHLANVGPNEKLQDIIIKYTKLKLLWDNRTSDYKHRLNKKILSKTHQSKQLQTNKYTNR